MVPVTTTDEQKIAIRLAPVTASGNPATLDGDVAFTVVEGDATVEVVDGTGGLEFYLVSGAANTVSRITATADADLGEGVREISEEFVYTVTGAEAAAFAPVIGTAEPK